MEVTNTNPMGDLDDMVYVSDGDESKPKDNTKQQPGMIPNIKAFYPGERDDHTGRYAVTDKRPDDLPEPEETDENGRYALIIRYMRCYDGRKQLSISSILVQSPLLKKVLNWVLKDYPCMAPELDRLEVVSPFRPFVHRWQNLKFALEFEKDPETKSHIQLFYDALKTELDLTLETRDDFFDHSTITFNALWMIFSPGDIIFTTHNKRQVAAKLVNSMIHSDRYEDVYRLECEMIHSDGKSFGWAKHYFDIPEFDGMRKITDLSVYPLDFHRNVDKVTQKLITKGKAYERLFGMHHKQYQGIALDGHHPFYVDSRIIIDGETYACHNPNRQILLKSMKKTYDDEESDSTDYDENTERPVLTDEQLMLCGNSVRGYSLRNKRWLEFFVDNIKDINWKKNAWEDVVLNAEQKELIFSVTQGHRLNHKGPETKGLNIVIGGPTGIGKTFAVESLAESLRAPLLHLTCADIDLDPSDPDLESPFTDLLEMCGKWNAILLHDEMQGSLVGNKLDNYRNECLLAMQALETHSTVFFVTCDSTTVECMNGRFLSRFHVALDLPELTTATRETMWQKCLESHKDISFFVDCKTLAGWTLNGREINNAITAAKTLAVNGTLDMKHLERVIPASKRLTAIFEDPWGPPVFKDMKKKMAAKPVLDDAVEIIEEPPKRNDDDWLWGLKKKTTKEPVESNSPADVGVPKEQAIDKAMDLQTPTVEDGLGSPPMSKDKKKKKVKTPVIDEIEEPTESNEVTKPTEGVANINLPPSDSDMGWGSFSRKEKKPDKKARKLSKAEPEEPLPAETAPIPQAPSYSEMGWAGFARKKEKKPEKKSKKLGITDPEEPLSAGAATTSQPLSDFDMGWGAFVSMEKKTFEKKPKKTKKKTVIEEPPAFAEIIQEKDDEVHLDE
ncbi:MAG: hypothetical protein L6R36_002253 [Xanthoria steineri]|nr:MAG: hypothetical protein L6R36_002253 [Xanthoria steineri]